MRIRFIALCLVALASSGLPPTPAGAEAADGRLSGLLRDDRGQVIDGAKVTLADAKSTVATATSSGSGRYSMAVPVGTYHVSVTARLTGKHLMAQVRDVEVGAGADSTLDLVLVRPYVMFTGSVRDGQGNPIPGVEVTLEGSGMSVVRSGADGSFAQSARPGRYDLTVHWQQQPNGTRVDAVVKGFDLSRDRSEDLILPFIDLDVEVHDEAGAPVGSGWLHADGGWCEVRMCTAPYELFPGAETQVRWGFVADLRGPIRALPGKNVNLTFHPSDPALATGSRSDITLTSSTTIDVVVPRASVPMKVENPQAMVTWQGRLLSDAGADLELELSSNGERVRGAYVNDGDDFMISVPAGHYDLQIEAVVDAYSGGFKSGDDEMPGLFVNLPDFDLTADRTQDLTLHVAELPVQVLARDGKPVAGVPVNGDSGGPGGWTGNAPVELFPGAVARGLLKNNPFTGEDGMARLLIFPGAAPPVVSAGLYDIIGQTTLAPDATSAVIRADAPILRGVVRDARGPITSEAWVSFRRGRFPGQFAPWGFDIGQDGSYQLQAMPGRRTLYVSNIDVYEDDERERTPTLPATGASSPITTTSRTGRWI